SFTSAVTTAPKAPPMTTATARSTTFPRIRKVLKPFSICILLSNTCIQELRQPGHGRLQYGRLGGVADAHRTLAARAKGHARGQPHARLFQQAAAETERIAQ